MAHSLLSLALGVFLVGTAFAASKAGYDASHDLKKPASDNRVVVTAFEKDSAIVAIGVNQVSAPGGVASKAPVALNKTLKRTAAKANVAASVAHAASAE